MQDNLQIVHYVYIMEIVTNTDTLYKIGYSSNVNKRAASFKNPEKPSSQVRGTGIIIKSIRILATTKFPNEDKAIQYERYLHNKYKLYKYTGKPVLPSGNTEVYSYNINEIELGNKHSIFKQY